MTAAPTTRTIARFNPRSPQVARTFVDFLTEQAALTAAAGARALQAQRETNERIDVVLVQLGLVSEDVLLRSLSTFFDMPIADAQSFPIEPVQPSVFPADFLRRMLCVPASHRPGHLKVITADPFASDTLASIGYLMDSVVEPQLASVRSVATALDRLYPRATFSDDIADQSTGVAKEDDVQRLRDIASEAPIIRFVNRMIAQAVELRASDIHVEPLVDGVRVRYRIDGILTEIERLPLDMQAGVASRIKILGNMNIAERRLPQDGRTKAIVGGREIDLRLSTTPLMHGESIVLRILDREAVELDFDRLGFDVSSKARLEGLLSNPNGIILVTGPTGSGKTTTLYAALKQLNAVERKVFTVEDPIEYQLAGVNQVQVKPVIGLDFVHCLRSILRQDPDVVMIGEMRDVETARTGIQASLTGHLVLSTLHTNSAAASVTRLLDMGVEDYLLASTVAGVLAQRLVRRLCRHCSEPDGTAQSAIEQLGPANHRIIAGLPRFEARKPIGCAHCRHTGFLGRTTIHELMIVGDAVRRQIRRGVGDREVERVAQESGMETLIQCGVRKVAHGLTTLDEVLRVART